MKYYKIDFLTTIGNAGTELFVDQTGFDALLERCGRFVEVQVFTFDSPGTGGFVDAGRRHINPAAIALLTPRSL